MSTFYKPKRGRRPSSTDWLQILDVDGPFLAAPVVHDTWPDGLPALSQKQMDALRSASALYDANPGTRDAFISHVLTDTLDWRHNLATGPDAATLNVAVPEYHQTVDIAFALRAQDQDGAVQNAPLLLGMILPPKTATTGRAPVGSGTWTAGPADRLAHALRMRKVPLGIVTNGDTWTLVTVSDGGAVSTATWTRHAWLEEPQTLRAFVALLTRTRFFGVPDDQTLPGLLRKSLARQEEVTERLAEQSQAVVEMLVATLGRLDAQHQAEHGERLLPVDVGPADVYQAAVTVLMRLVFLLYAEERGLLPLDDDTYANAYAVNTLADSLRDRATDHGEDALERTATGWYRLLALFRGVHRGARHEQLILPAYGGSLFDPDRFPWLEGRPSAELPLGSGDVPAIDDRTLLKALDSLQTLQFAKERRQVSYRSLDVEQIGYVYEGLLDQDALTATDWVVSIAVSDKDPRKNGPELLLTDLEQRRAQGDDVLATWLAEQVKGMKGNRSKGSILKALAPLAGEEKPRFERVVREACGNDDTVSSRVLPFAKLLRLDPRDLPVVYPPGSLYLTDSAARANSGAVYTPRVLAEQVVENTLEPIVYSPGPLETDDKSAWVLKTPEQILNLKVCDIAAGSGAFLVAAARYLADRLIEGRRLQSTASIEDDVSSVSEPANMHPIVGLRELAKAEQDELEARRDVIVNCIYGVDINPMAIEMAKLSLWLTSLDRNRPFSFLDDHLVSGDSLLGITNPQQLIDLHFDPQQGRELHRDTLDLFTSDVESDLKSAAELRAQIPQVGDRDSRDGETKRRLLRRAEELTDRLTLVADGLSAVSLAGGKGSDYLALASLVSAASQGRDPGDRELRAWTQVGLRREVGGGKHAPAHFPLAFPEVFAQGRSGFDAIVGNPPFLGNRHWKSAFGTGFQRVAAQILSARVAGKTDLATLFLRRGIALLAQDACLGQILAVSTREPESRPLGYGAALAAGLSIFEAVSQMAWPTASATVHVSIAWLTTRPLKVEAILDGKRVARIGDGLTAAEDLGTPAPLDWLFAFQGCDNSRGDALLLDALDPRLPALRAEAPDLWLPYYSGDDLSSAERLQPGRCCLYTADLTLEQVVAGRPLTAHFLEHTVAPTRTAEQLKSYPRLHLRWWQMWMHRAPLRRQLMQAGETALAMPAVCKYSLVQRVPASWIATNKVRLIEDQGDWLLALLHSQWFEAWLWQFSGRFGKGINVAMTTGIRTFPRLVLSDNWAADWLAAWDQATQPILKRGGSHTEFWNQFHSANTAGPDACRSLRAALDDQVAASNGLSRLASGPTVIDMGPRWGWDTVGREAAVRELMAIQRLQVSAAPVKASFRATARSTRQVPSGAPQSPLFGDDS